MSQIGENKIGKFELNIILTEIESIIKILNSFEGKVFGEYVREVIVTRMKNSDCDVTFNCVDIWFQNQTKADDFIKFMNICIGYKFLREEIYLSKNIDLRTFHEPKQYKYFLHEDICVKFNIIVHPSFPLNNFDVNCLTYFYLNGNQVIEEGFPEDKKEQIIEAIYKKEATMTKYYFFDMINHRLTYPERAKMMNELFENRGWGIIHDGIKFTSPFTGTFDDAISKEKFINKTLLERSKEKSRKIDLKQDIIEKKEIPIGVQWSPERAEIAKHNNEFIRVGGVKTCYRLLSGALRSWTSNDKEELTIIFNIKYRITGTPSNIFIALKNYGYSDFQIKEVIENSITKDNYDSTKENEYLEELERHKKLKELKEVKKNAEQVIYNPEYRIRGTSSDISNTLKHCGISDEDLFKKKDENTSEERRKQLIANFTLSDEIFKTAIVNRNKAFFECISDFRITDKFYISNKIIEYSEELSSELIIEELSSKK